MAELDGTVAIVTGGAGALGAAVVQELLGAGATVFVPFINTGSLDRLRQQAGTGAKLDGASLDLTDETLVTQCYTGVAAQYGGIDILVNIAGGFAGGMTIEEMPWSVWQSQLDLNLKTAVLSCKAVVPHLLARGAGAIVNVGTRTVTQSGAYVAAYGASKRAVIGLTEALAAELREHNVTVNTILPSVIDTPANRANNPNADHSRWVAPADIARVIRFLVGPNARVISGASIPVYGRA